MPRTTEHIVKEYVDDGYDLQEAQALAESYIINDAFQDYGHDYTGYAESQQAINAKAIKTEDPDVRRRVIKAQIRKREKRQAKERRAIARRYNIGCDFKGLEFIKEYEDELVYIPPSDYCFVRAIEKIIGRTIDKTYLNPFGDTLRTLRKVVLENLTVSTIPDIITIDYKEEDGIIKKSYKTIDKKKQRKTGNKILLINIDDFEYHAILIKGDEVNDTIYEHIIDHIETVVNLDLCEDQKKLKIPKYKEPRRHIVTFDIETSSKTEIIIDEETGKKVEKRVQVPEGVSYSIVDLEKEEVILEKDLVGENCYELFIEDVVKEFTYGDNILIYAHNGGCFDNIYAKGMSCLTFLEQIKKGRIKKLIAQYKDSVKKLTFLDTFCFLQAKLKDACNYFDIKDNKIDFDIVNKDHNFFVTNTEWVKYMAQDVKVLNKVIMKYESYLKTFGESITTNQCGIAGISWNMITNNSLGLHKTFISKDPTTTQFILDSRYGGRLIHWRKRFDSKKDKSEGLICIDGNSLFPSAMYIGVYPIGKYQVIPKETSLSQIVDQYIKVYLSIIEVTIDAGNIRYPLLPYRTDKGCIIYPNGVFSGVYNSVDLLEAINDGYKIIEFKRGVFWTKAKRIYPNIIKSLYDERKKLKKVNNPMEYLYKIMLNSTYGYNSLCVTDTTIFSDNKDLKVSSGTITKKTLLKNGQYEYIKKLKHPIVNKPIHLASFILAYARKIMNNIIREVGPENVVYGDTDSLYVKVECLKNIKESSELCGVKNDYGPDQLITKGLFLDTKRYFIEFNKADKEGKTYKCKFNGINFKNNSCLQNWCDNNDLKKGISKLYEWFYNNPDKNPDEKVIQERWKRQDSNIVINIEEMSYQVNPGVRYNWDRDIAYPIKLKDGKVTKYNYLKTIFTPLGPKTEFDDIDAYDFDVNNYGLQSVQPLTAKVYKDITLTDVKKNVKKMMNNKFSTSFVRSKKDGEIYKLKDGEFYSYNGYKPTSIVDRKDVGEYQELILIPEDPLYPKLSRDQATKLLQEIENILTHDTSKI